MLSIRRISILLRARGPFNVWPWLSVPEIEWADDAVDWDGADGSDDIGPPCTLLTSLSGSI